jgi:DNA-binding NarL/FixJ family response regulator
MLIGDGLTNRAIAERLRIGERTVETHVASVFNKLGCYSRSEVAAWAVRSAAEQPPAPGR